MAATDHETVGTVADPSEHLRELLQFVVQHRWVHDVQLTRFVELKWWEHIPEEWREPLLQLTTEELNLLPFGLTKEAWPISLCEFVLQSQRLSLGRTPPPWVRMGVVEVGRAVRRGMNPKKLHEVSCLAGVVRGVCEKTGCTVVLDVGSGLGYLGRCLSQQCGLTVLGLEKESTRVASATTSAQPQVRPRPYGKEEHQGRPCSSGKDEQECLADMVSCDCGVTSEVKCKAELLDGLLGMKFSSPCHITVQLTVDASPGTVQKLSTLLDHIQACSKGPVGVCIVGLHCCGNLTPDILRLFVSGFHPALRSLVLIGCCYHKMSSFSTDTATAGGPSAFPLSALLQSLMCSVEHPLSVFALRLAAQETGSRLVNDSLLCVGSGWSLGMESGQDFHPSMLEVGQAIKDIPHPRLILVWKQQSTNDHLDHMRRVAFRGILETICGGVTLPRKCLRGLDCRTFEDYADTVSTNLCDPTLKQRLLDCHAAHAPYLQFIEPFTALQVCLQGVMEALVLVDRWIFLMEHKLTVDLVPVFEDTISPRNMAFLVSRPH